MERRYYALVLIAIIAISLTGGLLYYNSLPKGPALLSAIIDSFYGKAKASYAIPVSIQNNGVDVNGVVVTLESSAFGTVSSSPFDITSTESTIVNCNVLISDITPGRYPIKISYTHNGKTSIVNNTQSECYVLPTVSIVDEFWYRAFGYPLVPEKSTIGPNDNTKLSFFIKSDSSLMYSGFTATATLQPNDDSRLTITPNFSSIADIGPTGKSPEYSFTITSHNMPPGQYAITIHLFFNNQEVATKDVIIKVQA